MESNLSSLSMARALKRIHRDYDEILNQPLNGVGVIKHHSNEFTFIVNMKMQHGIYEGIVLQLEMNIPHDYPVKPPRMRIMPGQPFDHTFHHHIFPDTSGYQKFCIDLLDNVFMNTKTNKTGWSSAYTFRSIFMQIQNFLADPDFSGNNPSDSKICWLKEQLKKYTTVIIDENGKKQVHSGSNPFPPLGVENFENLEEKETVEESLVNLKQIKEKLTCFFTRIDFLSDKEIILGYPISLKLDFKNRPEPFPIPEILSYEGYISEIQANPNKLDNFIEVTFKTAMGEPYNYWFPIYINEDHYQRAKKVILNSFSVLKYGPSGVEAFDFKPELILEILPAILNKMIVFILNGEKHMSQAAMEAYGQYLLLFKRLLVEFPELKKYIETKVKELYDDPRAFYKKNLPDIGNFLIILSFSDKQFSDKDLFVSMVKEFQTREIFWLFQNPSSKDAMKTELYEILRVDENLKDYLNNRSERKEEQQRKLHFLEKKLDEKFWKKFSQQYFEEDDIEFDDEFFSKPPVFKDKSEEEYWDKLESIHKEIKLNRKLISYNENTEFDEYFDYYFQKDRITIFDRCTETTKQQIMHLLYKKKNGILLFTITACKRFINSTYLEKLEKNYGIIEEKEALDLINYIATCKKNIKSFTGMLTELGLPDYYNEKETEFVRLIQSVIRSNYQKYTNILVSQFIEKKYRLDDMRITKTKFFNSKVKYNSNHNGLNGNNKSQNNKISSSKPYPKVVSKNVKGSITFKYTTSKRKIK